MVLLYLSIPIMIVAIGIATVPLLWAMRREERERRSLALADCGGLESQAVRHEERLAA